MLPGVSTVQVSPNARGLGSCPLESAAAYAPCFQRLACCSLTQMARHKKRGNNYSRLSTTRRRILRTAQRTTSPVQNILFHQENSSQYLACREIGAIRRAKKSCMCSTGTRRVFCDSFIDTPLLGSFFSRKNLPSQQCVRIAHPIYDTVVATATWRRCVESARDQTNSRCQPGLLHGSPA